ncbi:MAG: class I SAM-dependent methyltransferase [bacterium]|nr:class I SAM-dependent methyltransferase [bacterium]
MQGYYQEKLSDLSLRKCYEIASPRIRRYLEAEIRHVLSKINPRDRVLELGCGYGRVLSQLAPAAKEVVGIDNAVASLELGKHSLKHLPNCRFAAMNAARLGFPDNGFDVTLCIQNGMSAFHVDRQQLVHECIRVSKLGGTILFSTYAERFWDHRLQWFRDQSAAGLLGPIDEEKTRDGVIVCTDGFKSSAIPPAEFRELTALPGIHMRLLEVDESCLFCEIAKL